MKIKEGFVKKPIMDDIVVVPTGQAAENFEGLIKLNETASLIWDEIDAGKDVEQIIETMTEKYDVSYDEAKEDVNTIIDQMKEKGFFIDE